MQLTSPAIGIHGESAAVVVSGGLQTDPEQSPNDFAVVYLHADSPQEAIQQAIVGTIQVSFGSSTVEYTFTPQSAVPTASANQPFYIATSPPMPGSPPPPPNTPPTVGPVANWEIKLEDLADLPNPDWDYNDHHWTVRTVEVENFPIGEGTISGVLWNDEPTPNNVMDPTDPLLGGVAVGLFDSQGWFFQATRTNSAGEYEFADLPNAAYLLRVIAPGFEPVPVGPGTPTGPGNNFGSGGWTDPLPITGSTPITQNGGLKGKPDLIPENVGIESVTWVEIKDTGARLNPKDQWSIVMPSNPNIGGGDVVFPEKRVSQNSASKIVTIGADATKVEVRVQLSDKKLVGVDVRVRVVDVDDPSANRVVPNNYDATNDPSGVVDTTDAFSQIGNIDPGDNRGAMENATQTKQTVEGGVAIFEFTLPRKPGNNYRAVATINPDVDLAKFAGKKNDKEAKVYAVPATGNHVGAEVPTGGVKLKTAASKLLTVWRSLYTEMDSLSLPPAANTYGEVHPRNLGQHNIAMDPGNTPLPTLKDIFSPAYIRVDTSNLLSHTSINDKRTVEFQRYVEFVTALDTDSQVVPGMKPGVGGQLDTWLGKNKRDTPASDALWGVWVIGSYEGALAESGPNAAALTLGATIQPTNQAGSQLPIYLFSENMRRAYAKAPVHPLNHEEMTKVDIQIFRARVLAHEIMHRFGGVHGTEGILGDNANGTYGDGTNASDRQMYKGGRTYTLNLAELKLVRDSALEVT